ncbi:MAG: hypothetical protein R2774_10975 [Saprospiraceae bacterium]
MDAQCTKDAFFVQTYPNPTLGEFTLEIQDFSGHADVREYLILGVDTCMYSMVSQPERTT